MTSGKIEDRAERDPVKQARQPFQNSNIAYAKALPNIVSYSVLILFVGILLSLVQKLVFRAERYGYASFIASRKHEKSK